ncbi:hypothetical protein [Aeromonas salmonicida]|uniref:hypothetical protein n=1 Tax=Aeromonas salmonicida TaxID=645 RepID=UPI0012FBAA8E|nr:hypothetical protein [Aeromonas salmonicida]
MRMHRGFVEISMITLAAIMAALLIVSVPYLSWISKEGDGSKSKYETEMLFFALEGFYYSHCKGVVPSPTVASLIQEGFLKPSNISFISGSIVSISIKNTATRPTGEVIFNSSLLPNGSAFLSKYWRATKSGGNIIAEKQFGKISKTQYGYDQLFIKECG